MCKLALSTYQTVVLLSIHTIILEGVRMLMTFSMMPKRVMMI
jgi:hypothetical protein